jgi:hypothetical protein
MKIKILILFYFSQQGFSNHDFKAFEAYKNYCLKNVEKVSGIEKVKMYNDLSDYYYLKDQDTQKQIYYIRKAIEYSRSINDNYCISLALVKESVHLRYKNDDCVNKILNILKLGKESGNHEAVNQVFLILVLYNCRINNLVEAENYIKLSERYCDLFDLNKLMFYNIKIILYTSFIKDYQIAKQTFLDFYKHYNENIENYNEIEKIKHLAYAKRISSGFVVNNSIQFNIDKYSDINYNYLKHFYFYDKKKELLIQIEQKNFEQADIIFNELKKTCINNYSHGFEMDFIKYEYFFQNNKYSDVFEDIKNKNKSYIFFNYEHTYINKWFNVFYEKSDLDKNLLIEQKYIYEEKFNEEMSGLKNISFFNMYNDYYLYHVNKKFYTKIIVTLCIFVVLLLVIKFYFKIKK